MSGESNKFGKCCILICIVAIISMFAKYSSSNPITNIAIVGIEGSGHHSINVSSPVMTVESVYINHEMINIWRNVYLTLNQKAGNFIRVYISDKCNFIYYTTLKTGSMTTRKLIDIPECGFGQITDTIPRNRHKYWSTCGRHKCGASDYETLKSSNTGYFKMLFARNPITRFESGYNHFHKKIKKYKNESMLSNETKYTRFITYYYNLVITNQLHKLQTTLRRHLQPIIWFTCFNIDNITCFKPNFVGKTETLHEDIRWIIDNKKLGNNSNYTRIQSIIYNQSHATKDTQIAHNTTYKYKTELLLLCKLYWNDFFCGNYSVPMICNKENEENWHFPSYCVDLNSNAMSWS